MRLSMPWGGFANIGILAVSMGCSLQLIWIPNFYFWNENGWLRIACWQQWSAVCNRLLDTRFLTGKKATMSRLDKLFEIKTDRVKKILVLGFIGLLCRWRTASCRWYAISIWRCGGGDILYIWHWPSSILCVKWCLCRFRCWNEEAQPIMSFNYGAKIWESETNKSAIRRQSFFWFIHYLREWRCYFPKTSLWWF